MNKDKCIQLLWIRNFRACVRQQEVGKYQSKNLSRRFLVCWKGKT